ncbi:MAG TPA: DUF1622 domain-containing protein [Gemmatimonadaceae bacterium]|jgi:uncharacterized membrane protein|nr:DUF1622 domain-containing protein [Gemmatimonadaceae bacterium]
METLIHSLEGSFATLLGGVRLLLEALGAFWIVVGSLSAGWELLSAQFQRQPFLYKSIRLKFSRYLSLALEFQLAADILSTAIAPSFDELGKLAITAVIRTGLNYFLAREMREEQEELDHSGHSERAGARHDPILPVAPPAVRA